MVQNIVQKASGARKHRCQYAHHILSAFDHARRWAAMNTTRTAVMQMAHPGWLAVPFSIFSPQKLSNGKPGLVMEWIRYASDTHMHYVRDPDAGLVVPVVWRNHYSVLLIPRNPRLSVEWFDPNYMGRRAYPSLNVVDIQQILNRPVHVRTFYRNKPERVGAAPQDEGRHDVFCAVWVLWYMRHGVGWGPSATPNPKFVDVFRFLQDLVRIWNVDFRDYLSSESVGDVEADGIIATILFISHKTFRKAFCYSYV
jgi:hypothetical protein